MRFNRLELRITKQPASITKFSALQKKVAEDKVYQLVLENQATEKMCLFHVKTSWNVSLPIL